MYTSFLRGVAVLAGFLLLAQAEIRADILYVADGSQNVYQVNTKAAAGGSGIGNPLSTPSGGFVGPQGLVLDSSGNLYVADPGQSTPTVFKYTRSGSGGFQGQGNLGTPTVYSSGSALANASNISFDTQGNLFVANFTPLPNQGSVSVVPAGGGTPTTLISSGLSGPYSVAVSPVNGQLYVSNFLAATVKSYTLTYNGSQVTGATAGPSIATGNGSPGNFAGNPVALAFDSQGNLFMFQQSSSAGTRVYVHLQRS
jgi:sugar lactone lactonase YvrE